MDRLINRRQFLKLAGITGAAALMAACKSLPVPEETPGSEKDFAERLESAGRDIISGWVKATEADPMVENNLELLNVEKAKQSLDKYGLAGEWSDMGSSGVLAVGEWVWKTQENHLDQVFGFNSLSEAGSGLEWEMTTRQLLWWRGIAGQLLTSAKPENLEESKALGEWLNNRGESIILYRLARAVERMNLDNNKLNPVIQESLNKLKEIRQKAINPDEESVFTAWIYWFGPPNFQQSGVVPPGINSQIASGALTEIAKFFPNKVLDSK